MLEDTGLPTHIPIQANLNLEEFGQTVKRMSCPKPFPVDTLCERNTEDDQIVAWLVLQQSWEQWHNARDMQD
eukprot:9670037-Karenia_brevis.AAC.1